MIKIPIKMVICYIPIENFIFFCLDIIDYGAIIDYGDKLTKAIKFLDSFVLL